MISKIATPIRPNLLQVYLAWVDAWLLSSNELGSSPAKALLSLEQLSSLFEEENLYRLMNHNQLMEAVDSFKNQVENGRIMLGGVSAPSCPETNLFSQSYNPQTNCNCDKLEVTLKNGTFPATSTESGCGAIHGMMQAMDTVIRHQDEWNANSLFTTRKLNCAVNELRLANTDIQPTPNTCRGPKTANLIPTIQAPDRRPNPGVDGNSKIGNQLYPTAEQLKISTDAKYYGVIACGAGLCDEGLARAIADSCNDILIGDYCEAADAKGLKLFQQVGAAAMAFLKLCNLARRVSDWQFENLAAYTIQCRVLGYFRDHSRPYLPDGIYGSRMTGLNVHRHIDVAAFHGVMTASLSTGQELTEKQFMDVVDACVYINDFVDFRGDILRKQRENVILRGIRGNLCEYLNRMIEQCLESAIEVIEASELGALVVMGYCNWAIMGSHHKVYEQLQGVRSVKEYSSCTYKSENNTTRYARLVQALRPYGTLGSDGPRVTKKRVEMDKTYSVCRLNPEAHLPWLADATRSFLDPAVLRQLVDVVHYEWCGDVGAVDYCP
ncbi:uncharacterized protein N7482_008866 [Penicillium canariense]|uniref:Uncharacterized protein n=1 Tax=Penicillium canariense TaxID=189055 RepID=A0A9W9LHY4_9EURO|nr:uncharacterized protein N7482_008866 [Penicillium canariense]KAJ5157766.1 hypothetical protein N7482_008866 [Penicillium canariense]